MGGQALAGASVTRYSEALLPTEFGEFRISVYRPTDAQEQSSEPTDPLRLEEHVAVHLGELGGGEEIFCRIHSECFTSEVLGSLRCDCRDQLDKAMARTAMLTKLYASLDRRHDTLVAQARSSADTARGGRCSAPTLDTAPVGQRY